MKENDDLTAVQLAESIVEYLAIIQPVLFNDISPERRSALIDRLASFIVATADNGLARFTKAPEQTIRLSQDVMNATMVSILSQLGIAKEQMRRIMASKGVQIWLNLAVFIMKAAK
jgi:hypothetical protein